MSVADAAGAPVMVMLCDDSATVRAALAQVLEADGCRVVARAGDGRQALAALAALPEAEQPAVVLLDLEMPVMDGMTALPRMLARPRPPAVIVASAATQRGAAAGMAALAAGAVDYVPKPSAAEGGLADGAFRAELVAKVRGWARMRGRAAGGRVAPATASSASAAAIGLPRPPMMSHRMGSDAGIAPPRPLGGPPRIVGIGCSTGGPQALATLVRQLTRPLAVPVLVVQHMPRGFTAMLAQHLDRLGGPPCAEAQDGEVLRAGQLYVAPGERHLTVEATPAGLFARLSDTAPENFCRPAVDPMLRSLVAACGSGVLALVLTGMGQDGLSGCRVVNDAGGTVLAQDEASSVVWGMPGAVARAGLARALLPPEELGTALLKLASGSVRGAA